MWSVMRRIQAPDGPVFSLLRFGAVKTSLLLQECKRYMGFRHSLSKVGTDAIKSQDSWLELCASR